MRHALSIDLEEWFCAYSLRAAVPPAAWDRQPPRAEAPVRELLALLERRKVRATFFVLGWVARRLPALVAEIAAAGHELGTHGDSHALLSELTPAAFEEDLRRSLSALGACSKAPVLGYRAPSFSLTPATAWAAPALLRAGLSYSSSVFPMGWHPDCGDGSASLAPFVHPCGLREIPLTCVEVSGVRVPCAGGFYFRAMPYALTRALLRRRSALGLPAVFYLHPWELDPGQPRVGGLSARAALHYWNLGATRAKLERLLGEFEFGSIADVFETGRREVPA